LIGFELKEVIAAGLDELAHRLGLAVQSVCRCVARRQVGGDQRALEFGLGIETAGGGEFAFLLGFPSVRGAGAAMAIATGAPVSCSLRQRVRT
jgi:hypothetical protein